MIKIHVVPKLRRFFLKKDMQFQFKTTTDDWSMKCTVMEGSSGREIAPNTGAITTKFFTLATKS